MARPPKPLILRESVVEASLRIIDTEGLAAFSLPRLARELNVQAPSLYHHFADKAEILEAVARAIVLDTRVPDPKSVPNWMEWFVALSLAFRASMMRHRNAMPLLLQYPPRDVMVGGYGSGAAYLRELGVPIDQVVLIVEGLDTLTLGAGVSAAARGTEPGRPFEKVDPTVNPALAEAAKANKRSGTAVFAEVIRSFLRGAAPDIPDSAPPPRVWGRLGEADDWGEERPAS
ncbi:TetR/AcrR family transcriptional regulator [Mycolicibacterium thermoresistibile]